MCSDDGDNSLPDCVTIPPSTAFPNNEFPDNIVVPSSQVTGLDIAQLDCITSSNLPQCAQVDGSQLSNVQVTQFSCDGVNGTSPLPSCFSVQSTQVTGSINATLVSGPLSNTTTISGSSVTSGTIGNSTVFNGTVGKGACSSYNSNSLSPFMILPFNTSLTCGTGGVEPCYISCPAGYEFFNGCPGTTGTVCISQMTANNSVCAYASALPGVPGICGNATVPPARTAVNTACIKIGAKATFPIV